MTADPIFREPGVIVLNGSPYRLARRQDEVGYSRDYTLEPPYLSAVPTVLSEQQFTWHLGGFKSRQGIPGTSEYGRNTDGRWPFRLVPAAKINTITLPGNTSPIRWLWKTEPLSGLLSDDIGWATAGARAYATFSLFGLGISPADQVYNNAADQPVMGLQWQQYHLITSSSNQNLYKGDHADENEVPTGAGATTQWTPSAGSNFANVDDPVGVPDEDATYNETDVATEIDLFTKAALGTPVIPDGIREVLVLIRARRTSLTGVDPAVRGVIRLSGVNYFSSPQDIIGTDYVEYAFFFELNPATGIPWTITEFNNAEFGYELQTAPGSGLCRITQAYITANFVNWQTTDAKAYWIAAGPKRLFKIWNDTANNRIELKNLAVGLDPTVEANWADQVFIPGRSILGTTPPLVAYKTTAIVATDTGIYAVDEDGTGFRIIERIDYAPETMAVQDPWLYISHSHGLSRWLPGLVEDCGLEQEILNAGPIKGVVTSLAFIGQWIYASIRPTGDNAFILVGREKHEGEPGVGPIIWDTFLETGQAEEPQVLAATSWGSLFALSFELGNNSGYCIFPETGGVPEIDNSGYRFVLSGTRYSIRYRFDDWRNKNLYKILLKGNNLNANVYWEVAYSIDGGSWVTTDTNGSNMRVNSNSLTEFFIAATATGIEFQFRFTYTSNSDTARGELVMFEPFFIPRAARIPVATVLLLLESYARQDVSFDSRTAEEQLSDLAALVEAAPVDIIGPDGVLRKVVVRSLRIESALQDLDGAYTYMARLELQERESA